MVKDKKASEFATRDYTIHLSKRLYGVTFKKRAPRAVREVKKFAQQMMKTRCVCVCVGCEVCPPCVVHGGERDIKGGIKMPLPAGLLSAIGIGDYVRCCNFDEGPHPAPSQIGF